MIKIFINTTKQFGNEIKKGIESKSYNNCCLNGIPFRKHPTTLESLLNIDLTYVINNETISVDRKAHLFSEHPTKKAKIEDLVESWADSEETKFKLKMPADF